MQMWKYLAVYALTTSCSSTLMRRACVLATSLLVDRVCSFYYYFFICIFVIFYFYFYLFF